MNLSEFLDFDAVRFDLNTGTKRKLIHTLAQIAGERLLVNPEIIANAIEERERIGSTGFGGGVAIPHGKLDSIERVYGLVVRLASPIDYKAIDGRDVDLVFLILSPPDAGAEHLRALASVSRLIRNAAVIEKLRGARSRDAMSAVLIHADERDAA